MVWFKRKDKKVITETKDKKEIPEGLWYKCPKCKVVVSTDEHQNNIWVCHNCNHHERINSVEYFSILFDEQKFTELDANMISSDPLNFEDTKKYSDRLNATIDKTGIKDAVTTAYGKMNGIDMSRVHFYQDPYEVLEGADALSLLTEWKLFRQPDFTKIKSSLKSPIIFDGRNQYSPEYVKSLGFHYEGIGRV